MDMPLNLFKGPLSEEQRNSYAQNSPAAGDKSGTVLASDNVLRPVKEQSEPLSDSPRASASAERVFKIILHLFRWHLCRGPKLY